MTSGTGLNNNILSILGKIFEKQKDIEQVKLYGSRARGTYNERSDIDLIAYGEKLDRFKVNQIIMDLDDSEIPYLVDFQSFHDLKNNQLIEHINRVGLVIYNKAIGNK